MKRQTNTLDIPQKRARITPRVTIMDIPLPIFIHELMSYLNEVEVYLLHTTCKHFKGIYKHLKLWKESLRNAPYPLWTMVRNKWCPMCCFPHSGEHHYCYFGHESCYDKYGCNLHYALSGRRIVQIKPHDNIFNIRVRGPAITAGFNRGRITAVDVMAPYLSGDVHAIRNQFFVKEVKNMLRNVRESDKYALMRDKFFGDAGKVYIGPGIHYDLFRKMDTYGKSVSTIHKQIKLADNNGHKLYQWYQKEMQPERNNLPTNWVKCLKRDEEKAHLTTLWKFGSVDTIKQIIIKLKSIS